MTSGDSGTCTIFSLMETNDGTLDAETFTQHRNRLVLHEATSGNEIGRATVLDTHRLNVVDQVGNYRIVGHRYGAPAIPLARAA